MHSWQNRLETLHKTFTQIYFLVLPPLCSQLFLAWYSFCVHSLEVFTIFKSLSHGRIWALFTRKLSPKEFVLWLSSPHEVGSVLEKTGNKYNFNIMNVKGAFDDRICCRSVSNMLQRIRWVVIGCALCCSVCNHETYSERFRWFQQRKISEFIQIFHWSS